MGSMQVKRNRLAAMSAITDDQRATMTNVFRGAEYRIVGETVAVKGTPT